MRLTQLEIANSKDPDLITQAEARISAREKDISLLRAQILVHKSVQNGMYQIFSHARSLTSMTGSLPDKSFIKLRKNVALLKTEAMKCQLCCHRPDDAQLSPCGHIYCNECHSRVRGGLCKDHSCGRRLKRKFEIDDELFGAICTMLKVSFLEEVESDSSDDAVPLMLRRSRSSGGITGQAESRLLQLRSQLFHSFGASPDEDISEDDGFDNRSQRSTGYADDGNSFVSDDEFIDMTAEFEKVSEDSTTENEDEDMLMGSEEDE